MLTKKILQRTIFVSIIFLTTGCAMKSIQSTSPVTQVNQKYKVDMKRELNYKGMTIFPQITTIVYINNEVALKGVLSGNNEGKMEGMYDRKSLELVCNKKYDGIQSDCTVHLDNQRLGEFSFDLISNIKRID